MKKIHLNAQFGCNNLGVPKGRRWVVWTCNIIFYAILKENYCIVNILFSAAWETGRDRM